MPRRRLLREITENFAALDEFFVRGGVADAEMRIAGGEDSAGNHQDIPINGGGGEIGARAPPGNFRGKM